MTSSTEVAEQEPGPARPALDAPGRAALRAAIQAAVARARPRPVAVRTLELLAEAAATPDESGAGIRVLDRHGHPRLRPGSTEPMTLADLVAELHGRHPALFLPPETDPAHAPGSALRPEEAKNGVKNGVKGGVKQGTKDDPKGDPKDDLKDSALLAGAYEMKAATARFVGTQSERARSLAERSSAQSRVLAQNAAGRFATLRADLRTRFTGSDGAAAAPEAGADPAASWNAGPGRIGEAVRDRLQAVRDRFAHGGDPGDDGSRRQRRWLAGASVAALVAVIAAGLVLESPDAPQTPRSTGAPVPPRTAPNQPSQAAPQTPPRPAPQNPSQASPQASPQATAPDTVTPPPETGGDPEADPPPSPNALTGTAQVIDTATLKVAGKVVHLFGVEWVRGGQAEELARYIGGRPVTCQPAPGSASMNCLVDGRDISEVVLFNGGGRASPEASPELVAAEDHARSERLGVWKR
jgi:endonuclease YncB( thermonuclease family)